MYYVVVFNTKGLSFIEGLGGKTVLESLSGMELMVPYQPDP